MQFQEGSRTIVFHVSRTCFPALFTPLQGPNFQFWMKPLDSSKRPTHGLISSHQGEQNTDLECELWSRLCGFQSWHHHELAVGLWARKLHKLSAFLLTSRMET